MSDRKQNHGNEYSSLWFRLRLLICAATSGTKKPEYGGLYSGFMVRVFTVTARDALTVLDALPFCTRCLLQSLCGDQILIFFVLNLKILQVTELKSLPWM
jgi:hypothetical protein